MFDGTIKAATSKGRKSAQNALRNSNYITRNFSMNDMIRFHFIQLNTPGFCDFSYHNIITTQGDPITEDIYSLAVA